MAKNRVPKKDRALAALKAVQDAFARSVISEKQLQATGRRVRRELSASRFRRNR